ncbi:hypothetical protein [Gordonia sputi]
MRRLSRATVQREFGIGQGVSDERARNSVALSSADPIGVEWLAEIAERYGPGLTR